MTDAERSMGSVAAEISRNAVQLLYEYTGRGPTKARTTINGDLVVIVLGENLLKAERSLVENGEAGVVREMRSKIQDVMRDDLIAAVEEPLCRRVVAFMSANHIDPDLAAEVFVLAPDGAPEATVEPEQAR
jgi:uncharacterized protein YbcI